MTPQERAAMQQALDALEELHYSSGTVVAVRMYESATAALREALAEPTVKESLTTQEPVAWMNPKNGDITKFKDIGVENNWIPLSQIPATHSEAYWLHEINNARADGYERGYAAGKNAAPQPVSQEPVGRWNWNEAKFEWLTKFDYYKHHMTPLYAAPVRTKDLTDDEIAQAVGSPLDEVYLADFRAVIAADREKNK